MELLRAVLRTQNKNEVFVQTASQSGTTRATFGCSNCYRIRRRLIFLRRRKIYCYRSPCGTQNKNLRVPIVGLIKMEQSASTECSICQETPKQKNCISLFNCGHLFCIKCISNWVVFKKQFMVQHTCPNCRTEIMDIDVWFCIHYQFNKVNNIIVS